MRYRLIASDFDGTVYHHGEMKETDKLAIARWRKEGGLFGIVTGRGITFPQIMRDLGVDCDFFLCCNGAVLMDAQGAILREQKLDPAVFAALSAFFRDTPGAINYTQTDENATLHQYNALMPTNGEASAVTAQVNMRFGEHVNALANGRNINVIRIGESKAHGVQTALDHFHLAPDAAAVVGDELNDIHMIRHFNGWAMSTGRPEAIAAATHLCDSVADLIGQLEGM